MEIISWNVNSIKNKVSELRLLATKINPEVIMLQETWLKPHEEFKLNNYEILRTDREGRPRGGTALAIRSDIEFEEIQVKLGKIENTAANITIKNKNIKIISAYLPPNKINKKDIATLRKIHPSGIVCGDFNAKHINWGAIKTDRTGKYLEELCQAEELILHIPPEPTRQAQRRRDRNAILDYALTTECCQDLTINVLNNEGTTSDHFPLLVKTEIGKPHSIRDNIKLKTKMEGIMKDLDRKWTWTEDVNYNTRHFTSSVQAAILNNTKIIRIAKPHYRLLPQEIRELMKQKKKAQKTYKKEPNRQNRRKMYQLRNQLSALMKKKDQDKLISEINKLEDPIARWSVLKKGKPTPPQIPNLTYRNITSKNTEEKAEILGQALEEKFTENQTTQSEETKKKVNDYWDKLTDLPPGPIPTITEENLDKAIKSAKMKSAAGTDGITYQHLKNLPPPAKTFLVKIFNQILQLRTWPKIWRRAQVTMLLKPGKPPNSPNSYRPISLLPCPAKILERIIKSHINFKKIPDHQFGFRPHHSTTQQLQRIITNIAKIANEKETGILVSLDVEAAFDKIPFKELLFKLQKTKQPTWMIQLLRSYYTNRTFHVTVNQTYSQEFHIRAGTAQGAVLSPILYNLYVHDMPAKAETYQYADDTAYIVSSKNKKQNQVEMNKQLEDLYKWCQEWRVKINATKSAAILLRHNKNDDIIYGGEIIPTSYSFKYLGITIDKRLTFVKHITQLIDKCKAKTGSLMRYFKFKNILSQETRRALYRSLVLPSITYGLPAWDAASDPQWARLQVTERKWKRIITGLPRQTPRYLLYRFCPENLLGLRNKISLATLKKNINHPNRHILRMRIHSHIDGPKKFPHSRVLNIIHTALA